MKGAYHMFQQLAMRWAEINTPYSSIFNNIKVRCSNKNKTTMK